MLQKNKYKGSPERAWISVELISLDGARDEFMLIADTGSPAPVIISEDTLNRFKYGNRKPVMTNFGLAQSGWVRIRVSGTSSDLRVVAFGNEEAVEMAKRSSDEFVGLAGLPLLKQFEYGGDGSTFSLMQHLQVERNGR